MAKKKTDEQGGPRFEERLARLEQIVAKLESGNVGLDESLKLYAEGAELIKVCRKTLKEVETRITQLAESAGGPGAPGEEPFEPEESEAEP